MGGALRAPYAPPSPASTLHANLARAHPGPYPTPRFTFSGERGTLYSRQHLLRHDREHATRTVTACLPVPAWHRVTADYVNAAHFRRSSFHGKTVRECAKTHVANAAERLPNTSRPASGLIDHADGTPDGAPARFRRAFSNSGYVRTLTYVMLKGVLS